jgi:hypothetical protein
MSCEQLNLPIVLKSWTAEEAYAQQKDFEARNGNADASNGPLYQWEALHKLDALQSCYESGKDSLALLDAISICALRGIVIPEWAAIDYLAKWRNVIHHKVKTLDEAFGAVHPKGVNLNAKAKRRKLALDVYNRVTDAHAQGTPLDTALYEKIGTDLSIGKTLVQEYLAHARQLMDEPVRSLAKEKS